MTQSVSPLSDACAATLVRPERRVIVDRIERTSRPLGATAESGAVAPDWARPPRARSFAVKLSNLKEHVRSLRDLTRSRFQLREVADRTAAQAASMQALIAENHTLRQQIGTLQAGMDDLKARVEKSQEAAEASFRRAAQEMVRLHSVTDAQRRSYVEMTRQLAQLAPAEEPSSSLSDKAGSKVTLAANDPFLDIFYREFEDRYRGSREEILERLREYVGHIVFLKEDNDAPPQIIDLGCGRGEWLEVLREQGLQAVGVDTNEAQAEAARTLGLHVEIDDAISYLSRQKERSVDFISAFHLIEHLEFPVLTHLLKECLRVLKPGGRLMLETPNPHSLIVGAFLFWFDPTHVRPYPAELIRQLLDSLGFKDANTVFLRPHEHHFEFREVYGLADPIADLMVGSRDYLIFCRKP